MGRPSEDEFVNVVNTAGQVVRVHETHPILNDPNVRVLPKGHDPTQPTGPLPFEDWAASDLLAYAQDNGIDVGKATSVTTLAKRIRAAEGSDG